MEGEGDARVIPYSRAIPLLTRSIWSYRLSVLG
jgi:hypothetical protein